MSIPVAMRRGMSVKIREALDERLLASLHCSAMCHPLQMQEAVDKQVAYRKGCGGFLADQYLAGVFGKRKREDVGGVILLPRRLGRGPDLASGFSTECHLAHLC